FGLEVVGPPSYYDVVLPDEPAVKAEWDHIAYRFEYRHADGRDPETYVGPLRAAIEQWHAHHRPEQVALRYLRGPDFLTIVDERPGLPRGRYVLEDMSAEVYLACDAGATVDQIGRHVRERT